MRIELPHNTTRTEARQTVETRLDDLLGKFGGQADQVVHEWNGDTLHFNFKARGMSAQGTLEVTDSDVIIDGKLPLMAMPFESRIRSAVQKEAESMFKLA